MTFKTFARKFKKKANEWINNNSKETMWEHEHIRRQKSIEFIEELGINKFEDLETFSEQELLELLKTLENKEMIQASAVTRAFIYSETLKILRYLIKILILIGY